MILILKIPYSKYKIYINEKNQIILLFYIFLTTVQFILVSNIISLINFSPSRHLILNLLTGPALIVLNYYHYEITLKKIREERILSYKKRSNIITPEVNSYIKEQLKLFEFRKQYLKKGLNLRELSRSLNVSEKHLSLVIKNEKNIIPCRYINNLKVNHIVTLFETQPLYRKYEYSVLSNEGGFRTNQSLTNAFLTSFGKTPKTYVNDLYKT